MHRPSYMLQLASCPNLLLPLKMDMWLGGGGELASGGRPTCLVSLPTLFAYLYWANANYKSILRLLLTLDLHIQWCKCVTSQGSPFPGQVYFITNLGRRGSRGWGGGVGGLGVVTPPPCSRPPIFFQQTF